ncbi:helix-turn-helix transcriptional regulator [Streptomyces sp. NPDC059851]|uniref:helix-turn-helix transcriptional regulator n=1 Tax=Streptomyces sp. NPDC059851 TaxID=3346971 RepID=UPI00364B017B
MRADRLLSLLLLLQNRGRMTASELAAELEVSVRTVYRDIEALGASGVPVHTDRGPAGGYRLMDGYRTRLTGLTDTQADSLFLAGTPGPAQDLGLGADLAAARLKLQAALPVALADRARRLEGRFHLDATAWFRDADPVPHLARIARAVWDQRVLVVGYRRWNGEERTGRVLHPLGLVLKGGIWYLVAADTTATTGAGPGPGSGVGSGDCPVRTYRVSRFQDVDTAPEGFERPPGFDLVAHWEQSARRLDDALRHQTARVRLSPRGRRLLPMQFGAAGTRALAGAEPLDPADPDGWVTVHLSVESQSVAVGDLLRLGTEAEVLGPPELRRALADTVAALADRYRCARADPTSTPDG